MFALTCKADATFASYLHILQSGIFAEGLHVMVLWHTRKIGKMLTRRELSEIVTQEVDKSSSEI